MGVTVCESSGPMLPTHKKFTIFFLIFELTNLFLLCSYTLTRG